MQTRSAAGERQAVATRRRVSGADTRRPVATRLRGSHGHTKLLAGCGPEPLSRRSARGTLTGVESRMRRPACRARGPRGACAARPGAWGPRRLITRAEARRATPAPLPRHGPPDERGLSGRVTHLWASPASSGTRFGHQRALPRRATAPAQPEAPGGATAQAAPADATAGGSACGPHRRSPCGLPRRVRRVAARGDGGHACGGVEQARPSCAAVQRATSARLMAARRPSRCGSARKRVLPTHAVAGSHAR